MVITAGLFGTVILILAFVFSLAYAMENDRLPRWGIGLMSIGLGLIVFAGILELLARIFVPM